MGGGLLVRPFRSYVRTVGSVAVPVLVAATWSVAVVGCDLLFPPDDDTPPTVAVTAPADGAELSGVVALAASAEDSGGVFRVGFKVDGTVLANDYETPYSAEWDTSAASLGEHVITAVGYDAAGNSRESQPVTVTVVVATDAQSSGWGEDFESYPLGPVGLSGQQLSDAWLASGIEGTEISIVDDPSGQGGGRMLRIDDGSAAGDYGLANATFTSIDRGTFSFRIYLSEVSAVAFSLGSLESGSESLSHAFMVTLEEASSGDVVLTYSHAGGTYTSGDVVALNRWYEVAGTFDRLSRTYSLQLDGTAVDEEMAFDAPVSAVNNLGFLTLDGAGVGGDIYLDDIEVRPAAGDGSSDTDPTDGGDSPSPPGAPTGVSASEGTSGDTIALSWNAVEGADFYNIYRSDSEDGAYEMIGWVSATSTATANTVAEPEGYEIVPGQHYFYRVEAEVYDAENDLLIQGQRSTPVEGWTNLRLAPQDFAVEYRYVDYRDSDRNRTVSLALAGSGTKRRGAADTVAFSVPAADVQSLYERCLDHDLFRVYFTPIPVGSGYTWAETFTITAWGDEYTVRTGQGLTEEEAADVAAAGDLFVALAAPSPPSWVTASDSVWPNTIALDWADVAAASSYKVYVSLSPGEPGDLVGTASVSEGRLINITNTATRYVTIRSVDVVDWEGEPSAVETGTATLPTSLTIGGTTHHGSLSSGSDVDWYRFEPEDAMTTIAWDDIDCTNPFVDYDADIYLTLYDAALDLVGTRHDNYLNTTTGVSSWGLLGVEAGSAYYLKVTAYGGYSWNSGSYGIRVSGSISARGVRDGAREEAP